MFKPQVVSIKSGKGGILLGLRWLGLGLDYIKSGRGSLIIQYGRLGGKKVGFLSVVSKKCSKRDYPKFLFSQAWTTKFQIKGWRVGHTSKPIQLSRGINVSQRRRTGAGRHTPVRRMVHGGRG